MVVEKFPTPKACSAEVDEFIAFSQFSRALFAALTAFALFLIVQIPLLP